MARDSRLLGALGVALLLGLTAVPAAGSTTSSSPLEIAHWNGTTWTRVSTPHVDGALNAVTAISTDDVWTVGIANRRPLALHWNGSSWRQVAVPAPKQPGNGVLAAVSASSPKDVWAVGYWRRRTLIEHWNGHRWTRVPSPANGAAGYLRGVWALSTRDAWGVGSQGTRTLLLHWNGRRWARTPSPSPGAATADELGAVAGASAADVWAVGTSAFKRSNGAQNERTLVLHWNGSRWRQVPSPNTGPLQHGNSLFGVATPGAEVWAVGLHGTGRGSAPLAEHWTGHSWRIVATPAWPGAECCTNTLKTAVALGSSDVWAAGNFINVKSEFVPLVDRWDGTHWTRVPLGNVLRNGFVSGLAAVSANDVWLVATHPLT
jgi:hypothetical protein